MTVKIELEERSIKYGYIYWRKADDEKIKYEIGRSFGKKIEVSFNGVSLGEKNIDNSNRRFSVGKGVISGFKSGSTVEISQQRNKIEVVVNEN